jgi:hypothetical protein
MMMMMMMMMMNECYLLKKELRLKTFYGNYTAFENSVDVSTRLASIS